MTVEFGKGKFRTAKVKDAEWKTGMRDYLRYRDLGTVDATNGAVQAHVIKAVQPCRGPTGWHYHDLEFQMNYVLKGWTRVEFEGEGVFEFVAGDSWYQTPGLKHEVLEYSDDFTVLEINIPATFPTREIPRDKPTTA
jgi:quercetin dioxygenase-like cupin family protein